MRLLHFADLHLGVETYGHIDPQTGQSSRLADFLRVFDHVVDFALQGDVDAVLFCGDAYKTRHPTPTQQREFAQRLGQLTSRGISVFLLVGNHDQPYVSYGASTVDIFHTLEVRNAVVAARPGIYRLETRKGLLQIVALPWVRRGVFLGREESRGLTLEQIDKRLQETLTDILAEQVRSLEAGIPAVLAAHIWVHGARPSGSERAMVVGGEPQLLLSSVAHPAFAYVALGHIHRHQRLNQSPPVVYSGSLERLDFQEEADEKGFYVVELFGNEVKALDFHPVPARRFLTISISVEADDPQPTATVLAALARRQEEIRDAVVRLELSLPPSAEALVQEREIRRALGEAYFVAAVSRLVKREPRTRLGGLAGESPSPVEALRAYLKSRRTDPEEAGVLEEYGQRLIAEQGEESS